MRIQCFIVDVCIHVSQLCNDNETVFSLFHPFIFSIFFKVLFSRCPKLNEILNELTTKKTKCLLQFYTICICPEFHVVNPYSLLLFFQLHVCLTPCPSLPPVRVQPSRHLLLLFLCNAIVIVLNVLGLVCQERGHFCCPHIFSTKIELEQ